MRWKNQIVQLRKKLQTMMYILRNLNKVLNLFFSKLIGWGGQKYYKSLTNLSKSNIRLLVNKNVSTQQKV